MIGLVKRGRLWNFYFVVVMICCFWNNLKIHAWFIKNNTNNHQNIYMTGFTNYSRGQPNQPIPIAFFLRSIRPRQVATYTTMLYCRMKNDDAVLTVSSAGVK